MALRVLHVLPRDLARGAQVYARALADEANRTPGQHHEVAVLFDGPRVAARANYELGVRSGRLHAVGLDPRAAAALWRLVRRVRPAVVVAHGAEAMKYAAVVKSRHRPVVCHSIGVASPKALHGPSRALHTALLRRADLVTAVSTAVADELRETFGVSSDTLRVIVNGRDPSNYVGAPGPAFGAPPRLVFVGHLTRTKRPEVFVELVRELRARGCSCEAAMVGDGPLAAELAAPAASAGVDMLGRRDDVPALLQSASVFVFPSRPEGEGMPGVIIEAGLAGLPVVATDVPGVRDVVVDGVTGSVVGVDDADALTEAVELLLCDATRRTDMGESARARCTELFSLAASTAAFLSELDALVEATGA